MQYFLTVFLKILTMLLYAVPAFLLVKSKLVQGNAAKAFSAVLLYVCQPALTVSAFQEIEKYTPELLVNMLICFTVALVAMGGALGALYLLFRKKRRDVVYRVAAVASAFGNASFIGIPLLKAVFEAEGTVCSAAASYSIVFFLAMSALGWTVASAIITQDKKYISVRKIFFNPCSIALYVAAGLALAGALVERSTGVFWKIPSPFSDMFGLLGQMSTPLCMIVMGLRLATVDLKKMFCSLAHYLVIAVKQVIFPLCVFGAIFFLPIDRSLKICLFIMSCCPVAAVVQSYAELIGEGQESAADMVLLSSVSCILTVPLMAMLIPFL